MNQENNSNKTKWWVYLGFLLFPILIFNMFWRKDQLKSNPMYTVTVTVKQIRTLKNGLQIDHYYFVNGEKYEERYSKDERLSIIYPGGRYLVKFSTEHPSVSEVLWNKPVPDSVKEVPINGWETPPF